MKPYKSFLRKYMSEEESKAFDEYMGDFRGMSWEDVMEKSKHCPQVIQAWEKWDEEFDNNQKLFWENHPINKHK